jgi:uroporphyrinogen decarboxylase
MPVIFDLQVEAEILGCGLKWAVNNPPFVSSHPLADDKKLPCECLIPTEESGRLPMILDVMRRLKKEIGGGTGLYGLICGPFTLASHLRGSDIFMDMIEDPNYVRELVEFCGKVNIAMAEMYIDAGMDVIAVVDPVISQISAAHFEEMLSDTFKAAFDFIRAKGSISSFFVCGNAVRQIDVMCKTGPDSVGIDDNCPLAETKKVTDSYNIAIGGNIPLTGIMLFGNQQDNMKCVVNILDSVDHHNFILSPGCDMPYDIPVENTIAAAQAVKQTDSIRELIAGYEKAANDAVVEIPDYANLDKVLVELFMLDSETCAACTYMYKLVVDAYDEIKDIADYVEYKLTVKGNIARVRKMGIKNLPAICVNGDIKWVSLIPDREEFIKEVRSYAKK